MNLRELRQQTLSAIEYNPTFSGATKKSSITLLGRLAHQSESALMRCQIVEIEAADIRQRYAGKHAPHANRVKLSGARVVDNMEVVRLQKEEVAEGEEKLRKGQAKAARAQAKVTGQSTVQGRRGGRGGRGGRAGRGGRGGMPPPAKVQSENKSQIITR